MRAMPIVTGLSDANPDIKFVKANMDEAEDIGEEYSVTALPTFIVFKDGKNVGFVRGMDFEGVKKLLVDNGCEKVVMTEEAEAASRPGGLCVVS